MRTNMTNRQFKPLSSITIDREQITEYFFITRRDDEEINNKLDKVKESFWDEFEEEAVEIYNLSQEWDSQYELVNVLMGKFEEMLEDYELEEEEEEKEEEDDDE